MQCAKDPRYICPRETCLHEICPPGPELAEGEGPASRPRHAAAGDVNRSQECADCECLRIQRKFYAVGKSQNRCVQLPLDALNLGDSTRLPQEAQQTFQRLRVGFGATESDERRTDRKPPEATSEKTKCGTSTCQDIVKEIAALAAQLSLPVLFSSARVHCWLRAR